MKSLFKVTASEFKSLITPGRLLIAFLLALLPLIGPLASGEIDPRKGGIENQTFVQIARAVSEAATYAIIIRMYTVLRDNAMLDKNRATYLLYKKEHILFGKVIADAILFVTTLLTSMVLSMMIIILKNKGQVNGEFYADAIVYIISLTIFYVFSAFLLRMVNSRIKSKTKKNLFMGIVFLATIVTYLVLSITQGVVQNEKGSPPNKITEFPIQDFFVDNIKFLSFIPIINLGYIPLVLFGRFNVFWILPFIFECLIVIVIFWKKLSTWLKEYLCA